MKKNYIDVNNLKISSELLDFVNEMQEIVRMSCRGDQRKHEIWSELLESYIEEKLYNIKRHSDKEWAEVLSIPLKELRVHKASMRKALRNNVTQ